MSLVVWLPLTKDLRQQGLANINITTMGTLSFVDGKLGKAIDFNNSTSSNNAIVIDSNLCEELGTEYSAAVWVYPFGSHVDYNGCIISSGNWNTPNKRWSFGLSKDNSQVDVFGFNYNTYVNCNISLNTWTHIACVHKNGITKLYKNGIYIGEKQMAQSALDSDKTFTRVGMCSYGNFFGFNGKINDLRIYDHALSEMEVKQISQGLVLHYPLNNMGFGQENLLSRYVAPGIAAPTSTAAGGRTTWLGDYKITIPATENADTYFRLFTTKQLTTNATYTISCQVSGLLDGTYYRFPLYAQGNTAMGVLTLDHNGLCSLTFTMTYGTQTAVTGADGETVYICFMDDSGRAIASGQGAITVSNFKLEKGSIPTPWSPAPSDNLATQMGLNSNIEYDTSGYCNNGTRTGTFDWTSDTPKYEVSTTFDGTNYISTTTPGADILTLSCWVKTSKNKSTSQIMVADSTSQLCISFYSGTVVTFYAQSGYSTGSKCILGNAYKENDWNHLVVVKTGAGTRKVYCNGVEQTATSNDYWSSSSAGFTVARRETSSPNAFYGELCDVRAYATALSADDVKSLYQNCATIDSDGTIRGQIR